MVIKKMAVIYGANIFAFFPYIFFFFILQFVFSDQIDLISTIKTDDRLRKANEWVSVTSVLDGFTLNQFDKVTLMLPGNKALEDFENQFPKVFRKIVENKGNIETLILFGSTDMIISSKDIKMGKYTNEYAVISLLAEYASITPQGEVCISDYTRTLPCDSKLMTPCCSRIDMNSVIHADDGTIYLLDHVLMPQELFDSLS